MTDYRYRIMQRKPGGSWQHWMGKVFGSQRDVQRALTGIRDNARFFRWDREYSVERQPSGEWEACVCPCDVEFGSDDDE